MSRATNIVHMKWAVVENVKRALPAGSFSTQLAEYIVSLEAACAANPTSAELLTCLGIAYSTSGDKQKSVNRLEQATQLNPQHFFSRYKLAGLLHSLLAFSAAEAEALKALHLAANHAEATLARRQLDTIHQAMQEARQQDHCRALRFSLLWT